MVQYYNITKFKKYTQVSLCVILNKLKYIKNTLWRGQVAIIL